MAIGHILVIDADDAAVKVASYALEREGYQVWTARDAETGAGVLAQTKPDLVILDAALPAGLGLALARDIRRSSDVPVILTAPAADLERIRMLGLSIADYLAKPFTPREVSMQAGHAIARATAAPREPHHVETGDLVIDIDTHTVLRAGEPVHLTASEMGILSLLVKHAGRPLTRGEILSALWHELPVGDERAIDVHIHYLREKLDDPRNPQHILTVRGSGYRFLAE